MRTRYIFLDSNIILTDPGLRSPKFSALVEYARRCRYEIVLSRLVFDEVVANHQRLARKEWEVAEKAATRFNSIAGGEWFSSRSPDFDAIRKDFVARLLCRFRAAENTLLKHTPTNMEEALQRAVHRMPP